MRDAGCPSTFWILPINKATVPFLPEPELYFPAGSDLILELASLRVGDRLATAIISR